MQIKKRMLVGIAAVLVACVGRSADGPAEETRYLFSYFTGNGGDGLHFAVSTNGLAWSALKGGKSFLKPQVGGRIMRDPCIARGPDGQFHLVWTSSWTDGGIGLAHSKDLVTWSEQTFVPVMAHESGTQNCWAPEIVYDDRAGQFVIFWSSTIVGKFTETEEVGGHTFKPTGAACNHRIYATTTRDFKTFSPTVLLFDPGYTCIDATMVQADGKWLMFIKHEGKVPPRKDIRMAWADAPTGPWSQPGDPISPSWVEGPTAVRIDGVWHLYYDAYTRKRFEGLKSADLKTWTPITDQLAMPKGVRHGTVFAVPASVVDAMK